MVMPGGSLPPAPARPCGSGGADEAGGEHGGGRGLIPER